MEYENRESRPQIRKPIAGPRMYLGCLLVCVAGSIVASVLTIYAPGTLGAVETNPVSASVIRRLGSLALLVRLVGYLFLFAIAALPILYGRRRLRIQQYGQLTGRFVIFVADFLLSLAAVSGVMDAVGDAIFVLQRFNPFQSYLVELMEASLVALVLSLVLNKFRTDQFFRNLYQISMM